MNTVEIITENKLDNEKVSFQEIREEIADECYYTYQKLVFPQLTDNQVLDIYKKIKPIVCIENKFYMLRKYPIMMLRDGSYIANLDKDIKRFIDISNITVIGEFSCYHEFSDGHFTPKIANVLQQFPDSLINNADAFYIPNIDIESAQEDIICLESDLFFKSKVKALSIKN